MSQFSCSVIIPVYNKERTVSRAIDSVLAQSCPANEIVVINDGSSDGTTDVLERYTELANVRILNLETNKGVSIARNAGIAMAQSEWIALLDADDFWERDFLLTCKNLSSPDTHLIGSAYRFATHGGTLDARFPIAKSEATEVIDYFEWSVKGDLPFTCSSVIVRRAKLQEIGGFDSGLSMGEDQVVWVKLLCSGKAIFVNKVAATYDLTGSSAVSDLSHRLKNPGYLDVLVELAIQNGLSEALYFRKYVRSVCRKSLIYQAAYVDGRSLRVFLRDGKVKLLPWYERCLFWMASLSPVSARGPLVRSVIQRFNRKWS